MTIDGSRGAPVGGRQSAVHVLRSAASPSVLYNLVADVSRWPAILDPVIHVEHSGRSSRAERFELWVLVGDQVCSWRTRRSLDATQGRIAFEQERTHRPVTAMAGLWDFQPLDSGGSQVELSHWFTVDGGDAEREQVVAAVDHNSTRDLAALCRLATLGPSVSELVFSFSDQVLLPVSAAEAYEFVERSDRWPQALPHVSRVELTEPQPGVQDMEMESVTADGRVHTTRWLAPRYATGGTLAFVMFFAVSVSATAFPVLARILTDKGLERTLLGGLSLASAAVIDVVSCALLAVVVAIASAAGHDSWRLAFVPVYFLVMLGVVRPFLRVLVAPAFDRAGWLTPRLCGVLVGLFFSAWVCQWMQVNFIFGAFLYGAIMPRSEGIIRHVRQGLESAVHLMLPMFFVITGLTVNLTTLHVNELGILAAILAVAILGKVGGGYAGARLTGIPPRGSAVMAALVNTRGLTELVILSVGLQEHLLSLQLYALMIVMALVTTAMTGPLLNRIQPMVISAPDVETTRTSAMAFSAGGLSANMASARPVNREEES